MQLLKNNLLEMQYKVRALEVCTLTMKQESLILRNNETEELPFIIKKCEDSDAKSKINNLSHANHPMMPLLFHPILHAPIELHCGDGIERWGRPTIDEGYGWGRSVLFSA